jgi:hypothetical protein
VNIYRVGDLLPALDVRVEDTGVPIDVTALNVYVRWERPDGTVITERTLAKLNAGEGHCAYVWQAGDLSVPGIYRGILQLAPSATPATRQSLATPPELYVEVLPNDFAERDAAFNQVMPVPSSAEVGLIMGEQPENLEPAALMSAIDRARRLAYAQAHIDRLGGALGGAQLDMLRDLVAQLAAMLLIQPPSAVYGPYQREQMASYSYDMRRGGDSPDQVFGVPQIDGLIKYFRDLARLGGGAIAVEFPEWWQPVTERLEDPSRLGEVDL